MNKEGTMINAESPMLRTEAFALSRKAVTTRAGVNNEGENMLPGTLVERSKIIGDLSHAIDEWVMKNMQEGDIFNQERLGQIVHGIGESHKELLDRLVAESNNRTSYVGRPNIKIYDGVEGILPDIWLLGWREDATTLEATDIHDHVDSQAAFHVYQGCVDEIIYTFDQDKWHEGGTDLPCQKTSRGLRRGSTATIPAPYVHIVKDARDFQPSVTVHAYYPPLDQMNFYEEKNGVLVPRGGWDEKAEQTHHCGSHCHTEEK